MKNFLKSVFLIAVLLVTLSCQNSFGPESAGTADARSAGAAPVQLLSAKATADNHNGLPTWETNQVDVTFKGVIEVANLAFNKTVLVHYSVAGLPWTTVSATYTGPASAGREYWSFENIAFVTTRQVIKAKEIRFAVEYKVSGKSYWDNNGGNDFFITTPAGVGYGSSMILGSANIGLVSAATVRNGWPAYANNFSAQVLVKNLGYHKTIRVIATTNGWQTSFAVPATYITTLANGQEMWQASTLLPLETQGIEFAISYTVNGQTWWDNNCGRNYILAVPQNIR